ncbi:hypothetical protein ETH_00022560 [Eimeria tenella]|uniref:Uncharacterized protein n=1 Tax=Eimeria tenella TaxID=5802 RepID=U6KTW6_EIMTE|nr:hypothetical protein ETH_00022560 [Eimeria tenella]CDJ41562.1 hypothetical protein ETH_00022560 [Eimeria tenella]|eukprot:XP_013232312.1 hypothetical protein ETH_00022560 [Eimeria tenella]
MAPYDIPTHRLLRRSKGPSCFCPSSAQTAGIRDSLRELRRSGRYQWRVSLQAFAKKPSAATGADIPALLDCNIHGEIKLGKDVEAIVVPKSSTRDKAMLLKLRSIATLHLVPMLSMEACPIVVKNDSWKRSIRHLQHEVLLNKTALGNTYGQI